MVLREGVQGLDNGVPEQEGLHLRRGGGAAPW